MSNLIDYFFEILETLPVFDLIFKLYFELIHKNFVFIMVDLQDQCPILLIVILAPHVPSS